jgi:hypothetical protein
MNVLEALEERAARMSMRANAFADAAEVLAVERPLPPAIARREMVATLRAQAALWDAVLSLCGMIAVVQEGETLPGMPDEPSSNGARRAAPMTAANE